MSFFRISKKSFLIAAFLLSALLLNAQKSTQKQLEDKKAAILVAKKVNAERGYGNLSAKDLNPNKLKDTYSKIKDGQKDNNSETSK